MAIAPAPVVVNTPDLIGYARQLKQQELERQNQMADYLGKFTKKQGQHYWTECVLRFRKLGTR
jgi:hypothetical protein